MGALVFCTALAGIVSALATGLGAFGAALIPNGQIKMRAFANAAAAGMMVSASMFSLVGEGLALKQAPTPGLQVVLGLLAGSLFFWGIERLFDSGALSGVHPKGDGNLKKRSWLVFVAMFIHSIPEGIALGVGFATGEWELGALVAIVIAIHNIPEGLAIALPLRAEGGSLARSVWLSIASSLPQPILAVPALLGFAYLQALLPAGLGFAAGAMMYLSFAELVPAALKDSNPRTAAWGLMAGLIGMLAITILLDGLPL